MKNKLKIAFMGVPMLDGNYTHFNYLADGIPEFDWSLINVGKHNYTLIGDARFIDLGKDLDKKKDFKELAFLLYDFLVENKYDVLIPMNYGIAISIIPHLPEKLHIVNIVNSNTQRVYKAVSEYPEYISKIICISKNQIETLGKIPEIKNKLLLIPHGVKSKPIFKKKNNPVFKIGFLGRIHHGHKGVLFIPEILKDIKQPYIFEIVGDGEDKGKLIEKLENYSIPYEFHGFKSGKEKEQIIKHWDVLLFPSIIEGFGLSLIEVMNHGVIPIANKIDGVTDYIISDKKDGFLINNNKIQLFRECIHQLITNRELKESMSLAANQKVLNEFNLESIVVKNKKLIEDAMCFKKEKMISTDDWEPFVEYKPSILQRIINRL